MCKKKGRQHKRMVNSMGYKTTEQLEAMEKVKEIVKYWVIGLILTVILQMSLNSKIDLFISNRIRNVFILCDSF